MNILIRDIRSKDVGFSLIIQSIGGSVAGHVAGGLLKKY